MSTQHTPGPWRMDHGANFVWIKDATGAEVIHCFGFDNNAFNFQTNSANARLIAAAPEMKLVLEKLAEWNKKYPPGRIYHMDEAPTIEAALTKIINEGIEVLKKAKGQ